MPTFSLWLFIISSLFVYSETTEPPFTDPTLEPTLQPSSNPTLEPTIVSPTSSPTHIPTHQPVTNVECVGYSNCWGTIITDYGSLTCDGEYSCAYATFKCKTGSMCHLQCNSQQSGYSCSDMTVDARYAKLLTITSIDIDSVYDLQNTRIYCPIEPYKRYNYSHACIVNYAAANRHGSDFIHTKFYTVNGLKDIDFRGNSDGLLTILKYNISVFYGNQYSKQCIIQMSVDSLICIDVDSSPTSSPTSSPNDYIIPTSSPTAPQINTLQTNPLFCRGYHFLQNDIAGSNVIDCNYKRNVDTFNDVAKSCQYSSLSFSTAYSSYESYSTTDSTSIAVAFNNNDNGNAGAGGAGSLSYSRMQTATTIKNSQSYIYRLDFSCVEADINLPSYPKVKWDDDFLNDLQRLPTQFVITSGINNYDVYSYEEFINFWKKYGTHIIQSGKLGGRVYGTVIIDTCSVNQYYSSLRGYTVCLNAEFSGNEAALCQAQENGEATQTSAQYSVSKTTLNVKGGDSDSFGEIINKFGDTNKERSYEEWIDSLSDSAYVVGGNLQEIYSVIKDVVHSNIGVSDSHGMNKYCDDTTLLQIANAMQNAYQVYVNQSLSQETDIQCDFECGKGTLNTQTCQCEKCKDVECCGGANHAFFYDIYTSVIFIYVLILINSVI